MSEFVITKPECSELEAKYNRVLPEKRIHKEYYSPMTVKELIKILRTLVKEDKTIADALVCLPAESGRYDGITLLDDVSVISARLYAEDDPRYLGADEGVHSKEEDSNLVVQLIRNYRYFDCDSENSYEE